MQRAFNNKKRLALWGGWLFLGLLTLAFSFTPAPQPAQAPGERTIRVEASSFAYAPETISVPQGERVTIELVSTDVVHGLYLDGYGLDVVADPGQTARLTFVADRAGSFRFRCSVTCGALHPFMIGKLRVGANTLPWRAGGLSIVAVLAGLLAYKSGNPA